MDYVKDDDAGDVDESEAHNLPGWRQLRSGQWWRADERGESPGAMVNAVVGETNDYHAALVARMQGVAKAYGAEDLLTLGTVATSADKWKPTNVLANIIDSMQADVFKNVLVPMFVTDRGSWAQQRRARDLSDFVEGVEYESETPILQLLWGLHALLFGIAICKCVETDEGRIGFECTPRWEVRVDPMEAHYRKPRSIFHRYTMDRGVLFDTCATENGEGYVGSRRRRAQVIDSATLVEEPWFEGVKRTGDLVTVTEAWHLPSGRGATDGSYVLTLSGSEDPTLIKRPYRGKNFPMRWLWLNVPLVGIDGDSIASRLLPNHEELRKLDLNFREAHDIATKFRIFCETGSVPEMGAVGDVNGQVVVGSKPPLPLVFQVLPPEAYAHRSTIKQEMYEIAGTNGQNANAQLPAGMSGDVPARALRMMEDQHTARHAPKFKLLEAFTVSRTEMILDKAEEIAQRDGDYTVMTAANGRARTLSWAELRSDKRDYVLKCFSTSGLSKLPGARRAELLELYNAGVISLWAFRKADESLDVKSAWDIEAAPTTVIIDTLEKMVDKGAYLGPEPFDDPKLCKQIGRAFYAQIRLCDDVSAERKALVQQFIEEAVDLEQKGQPPPPAPMPGLPGAGGPPGLPPPGGPGGTPQLPAPAPGAALPNVPQPPMPAAA